MEEQSGGDCGTWCRQAWVQILTLPLTVNWAEAHNLYNFSLLICKMGLMTVSLLSGTWLRIINEVIVMVTMA